MRGITISGTVYPQVQVENCDEGDLNELDIVVEDADTLLILANESEIELPEIFCAVVRHAKQEGITHKLPNADISIEDFTDEVLLEELRRRLRGASNDS